MSKLVEFSEFRFDSLRKYMAPIYATLNRHSGMPLNEKEAFVQKNVVPEFYRRMRDYRGRSLDDVAEVSKAKVSIDELQLFESGQTKATPEIDGAYCKACYGDNERIYFWHQVRAFYQPSIRESEIAMAKDVWIRFGLTSAYVDYQNLNAERGKVLEFRR